MTITELAARDQAEAKEREFERRARKVCVAFIYLMFAVGAYSWLAVNGLVPAAPWSPIGQQAQVEQGPLKPAPIEIPEGYAPAVPIAPAEPPSTSI